MARAAVRTSSRSRSSRSTSTTSRRPTCARSVRQHVHRRGVRHARDRAAAASSKTACSCEALSNGPTLAFKDMAMQLLGNLFEYELARRGEQLNILGRDLRRHRQRGRIRDARQAGRARVHDLAPWPHEPVPAGADVQPAGRQHPQPRHRRRVRRLPGHRQGRLERPRVQAQVPHRHGQLDQLGAAGGAGRLLLRRLFPGDAATQRASR